MERFISEECYNEIMGMAAEIVAEAVINELDSETIKSYIGKRIKQAYDAQDEFRKAKKEGKVTRELLDKVLKAESKAQYAREKGGQALNYSAKERNRSKRNMEERIKENPKLGKN